MVELRLFLSGFAPYHALYNVASVYSDIFCFRFQNIRNQRLHHFMYSFNYSSHWKLGHITRPIKYDLNHITKNHILLILRENFGGRWSRISYWYSITFRRISHKVIEYLLCFNMLFFRNELRKRYSLIKNENWTMQLWRGGEVTIELRATASNWWNCYS